jgi:hypothetical protein
MLKKLLSLCVILLCSACSPDVKRAGAPIDSDDRHKLTFGSLLGDDFFTFGGPKKKQDNQPTASPSAKVNPFLWRSSLETLSFMPLASADIHSGLMVSDWYVDESKAAERIKITIHFMDSQLRADSIKLHAHKQILKNNQWISKGDDENLSAQLEDIIIKHARNLKVKSSQ